MGDVKVVEVEGKKVLQIDQSLLEDPMALERTIKFFEDKLKKAKRKRKDPDKHWMTGFRNNFKDYHRPLGEKMTQKEMIENNKMFPGPIKW